MMDYYNPYMARYQSLQAPEMFRGQITRVNGRNGAEAFRMAQNSSALLLDENDPIVWLAPLYAAMAYKLISGRTSVERLEPLKVQGDSEFLRTAGGKDPVKVLAVMDELMGAVAALNKNLYEATIEKIKAV